MLFIYWGWDTSVSVNEETTNKHVNPGRAAVISTVVLLAIYEVVVLCGAVLRRARDKGYRLGQPRTTQGDVLSVLGGSIFGSSGLRELPDPSATPHGAQFGRCLHADHDPPTARTTLSMAVYKAIPSAISPDPQEVPDADVVDRGDGRYLDSPVRDHELHFGGHRDIGLG